MTVATTPRRVYKEHDPDIPQEFRELLIRMLTHHLENSTNPHYTQLLVHLWERCMTLAPTEDLKISFAKLMSQEVEHGVDHRSDPRPVSVSRRWISRSSSTCSSSRSTRSAT